MYVHPATVNTAHSRHSYYIVVKYNTVLVRNKHEYHKW